MISWASLKIITDRAKGHLAGINTLLLVYTVIQLGLNWKYLLVGLAFIPFMIWDYKVLYPQENDLRQRKIPYFKELEERVKRIEQKVCEK